MTEPVANAEPIGSKPGSMGPLVGVLGGGQLGRMLALAGLPLGLRFRFLDPSPTAAAAQVGEHFVGPFDDPATLDRFGAGLSAVTCEFENVPVASLERLAARVPVFPAPEAFGVAQDRLREKRTFRDLGIPTPRFAPIDGPAEIRVALDRWQTPAILKTRRLGYDGKGQARIASADEAETAWEAIGRQPAILEERVPFDLEFSTLLARSGDGSAVAYDPPRNEHRAGMLRVSRVPAEGLRDTAKEEAFGHARRLADRLGYVGVLAVEWFLVGDRILANEIAPRVHNSGHWTIEASRTSQFENHLRAGLGLPLGDASLWWPASMINLIGQAPAADDLLAVAGSRVHLYDKAPRPGRKLGHVTLLGDRPDLAERERDLLRRLAPTEWR